jgi:enoyl-CoA hydratase
MLQWKHPQHSKYEIMTFETILYSIEDRVAHITLNQPDKRNALNWKLLGELSSALKRAELDKEVRVIIIKGAGTCFCSGHNVADMGEAPKHIDERKWSDIALNNEGDGLGLSVWDSRAQVQGHIDVPLEIWNNWKPVIAQVHAHCLGGGSGIALACDLLIASEDARIGYPPARSMAPGEEISLFAWHVGLKKAKELALTGDSLTADEMLDYGIANYVFPTEDLDRETTTIARRIANVDSELLMLSKTNMNRIFDHQGFSQTIKNAGEYVSLAHYRKSIADFNKTIKEKGIKAALEQRDEPFGGIDGRYPPVKKS